ncbi:lipocalin family protein [Flavobacteriaceae bacterium XHP0103]|uniref:lipocalin family protein n=1 Tax=Marixanthotalea marina TaxID=2844359 RepID=UPI002989D83F|nr:lipocalin family protein [Marixanthotalea marina]MBU3820755.1 lipocalin family protein [Marixanthotalea marina]
MKKIISALSICALLITVSCGSSKIVRTSEKTIKGNWVLSSIMYSQSGTYNTALLSDVSKECFEGSTWQFVPNNNTGIYTINDSDCSTGERYFVFTIQEVNAETGLYNFLLKPTNERYKSETNQGFRLKLSALSDMAMQWQQTVNVAGSPLTINMNFTKQ